MSCHLGVFLNTSVENSGTLAWIGDTGLTPFRYLFNGKTIRIEPGTSNKDVVHRVASFHTNGSRNTSNTNPDLQSSSTGMMKTALSVVLLIPGLMLALFKGMAYLSYDVREKHRLVKWELTALNVEIGRVDRPITTLQELKELLQSAHKVEPKNHATNALIIYGDGNLCIDEDPGILDFNPMKLILLGAHIAPESSINHLKDKMHDTDKWKIHINRGMNQAKEFYLFATTYCVKSVKQALQITAPKRSLCKRYHMILTIQ